MRGISTRDQRLRRNPRPVREDRDPVVFDRELDPDEPRDVENNPTMDPDEHVFVEQRLELGQRLLLQVSPARRLHRHVIVLRFEVVDLLDRNHVHVGTIADENPLERRLPRASGRGQARRHFLPRRDSAARAIERLGEPLRAERLEQVVDGVHLERADGVLVVGSGENHRRLVQRIDFSQDIEAVAIGHLDVQKEQIRAELEYLLDRAHTISRFPG